MNDFDVADRARFIDELAAAAAGSHRGNPAVLVVDLDDFSTVNDVLGYLVGDRVLAGVAAVLRDVVRGLVSSTRPRCSKGCTRRSPAGRWSWSTSPWCGSPTAP